MGLGLAEPDFHTRAYVEWEEYPRSVIIAAQLAGYLAPAPIWDDLTTFNARPLAGAIDTLLAGYPCQPFSAAGQRRGEDDERHLWPDVARVADELGDNLNWIFLENVAGHVSLGAETVLRELRDMGFTPATGLFSAEETGATHERLRWFCVAYRESSDRGCEQPAGSTGCWRAGFAGSGAELVNALRDDGILHTRPGAERRGAPDVGGRGADVGDAQGVRRGEGQPEPVIRSGRDTSAVSGGELADARQSGPQGREQPGPLRERDRTPASGSIAECRRPFLAPPGPNDRDAWSTILSISPDLAPSVSFGDIARRADQLAQMVAAGELAETQAEPALCRMVDGLASRTRALKLLGNGVHPLAAGYAWRTLSAAHGLRGVDLGATGRSTAVASDEFILRGAGDV